MIHKRIYIAVELLFKTIVCTVLVYFAVTTIAGCILRPDIRKYNGMFRFKTANDTTLLYAEFDGTSVDAD